MGMLTDGSTAVLVAGLALLGIHKKRAVMGSVDLQAYLLRKDRGGDDDPALEGQLASVESGSLLDRLAWLGSCLLVMLFGLGCYWYFASDGFQGCGHTPGSWM